MRLADQLREALDSDNSIDLSDEEIFKIAAELVAKDPKKRFSATGIKEYLAKRAGRDYVIIRGGSLEMRLAALARDPRRKIVPDRARGAYQLVNATTGKGIEYRKTGQGELDILWNGEHVGEIINSVGDFKVGAMSAREKTFEVNLELPGREFTGAQAPPEFKTLTAAKKWVQDAIGR